MSKIWTPQKKQAIFMARPEYEALYGGAAGGGKSDCILVEALRQVNIQNYRAIIFRDTVPQLEALISRSQELYKKVYPKARYNDNKKVWTFPTGSKIFFGYMQRDQDRFNYQGKPYDLVIFDELTHFSYLQYEYMKSRNRASGPGTRVYIRATCNPDGKGMGWVKSRFVTPAPPMTPIKETVKVTKPDGSIMELTRDRIFVPSSVFDNEVLLKNNPDYLATLASLPKAERDALLYGSWDSFTGQVFTEWRDDPEHYKDRFWTHVIEPFDVPKHWKIVRGFDFGFSKPFSVGWFALEPKGNQSKIYRIKEYYGCTDTPNEGLKLNPYEIAHNIAEIERTDPMLKGRKIQGVADPAIWDESHGESIAMMMERSPNYVYFTPGDHTRLPGKMQFHYRMAFDSNGECMFQVFNTCKDFIRTVPMLTYSETHPEDIESSEEDHAYDECRYVFMENIIAPRTNVLTAVDAFDPLMQRINQRNTSDYINI